MVITIKSFDGFNLDDATYFAGFPGDGNALGREASPVILPVIGGFARDEGFDHRSSQYQVVIGLRTPTVANIEALNVALRAGRSGPLVVDFDGAQRRRMCRVESNFPHADGPAVYVVNLVSADPRWRALTDTAVVQAVTASGQQWTVTNAGNAVVDDAVFTIKPTTNKAAANSRLYRRHAIVANRVQSPLSDWPIDITNGGIDHAALVTAVKSLASAADVAVIEDGVEIPRYPGEHTSTDPNSATSKFWVTPAFAAGKQAKLLNAITAGAPATDGVLLAERDTTKGWPDQGWIVIESSGEVISYSGVDHEAASFTGIKRGQRGSTAASASAGNVMREITKKLELVYGWTGAPLPVARPERRPLFNLASSALTNIRHEWTAFYDDLYPSRPGGWTRSREDRDSQSNLIFLPRAPVTPASNMAFEYVWTSIPTDKDNFNVLRRSFPVRTDGASGQFAFTRQVDTTMQLHPLGVTEDGIEQLMESAPLMGPLSSGSYSHGGGPKFIEVGLYARSSVLLGVPEVPQLTFSSGSITTYTIVSATDSTGITNYPVKNAQTDPIIITHVYAFLREAGATKIRVFLYVNPDNGSGAPDTSIFSAVEIPPTDFADAAGHWEGGALIAPLPLYSDQIAWLRAGVIDAGTHSSLEWAYLFGVFNNVAPLRSFRFCGIGPIQEGAHAEQGEKANASAVIAKFDTTGTPYFALMPEQACYWLTATLKNNTTGQSLSFNLYVSPNDEIEVDCGRRTVTNLTTGETGLLYGMEPSDKDLWITLAQGANQMQLDETGLVAVTVTSTFKAAYE